MKKYIRKTHKKERERKKKLKEKQGAGKGEERLDRGRRRTKRNKVFGRILLYLVKGERVGDVHKVMS